MNESQLVVVFNASSRQGQCQLRQLLRAGHRPRAITRQATALGDPEYAGVEIVAADYTDPASLQRAVSGADAVFFQPPLLESPDRLLSHTRNLGEAMRRAKIGRLIHNSTMWSPDPENYPTGQPTYDLMREIEVLLEEFDIPITIFRPTLYMDNWLTSYARPVLIAEQVYRYPHKPSLRFAPISLDDVAKFMVAALTRDDLAGQRFRIAGPQILSPEDVRAALSEALGTSVRYEYQSPADFAAFTYDNFVHKTGAPRDLYIAAFDNFYSFNNDSQFQPFAFDVGPVLEEIPLNLETFHAWSLRQNWGSACGALGSVSG